VTVAERVGPDNATLRIVSQVVAAYLACAFIWGTTWYAIRVCIADYPTLASVALRFVIAVLVLLPLALRARPWPRGRMIHLVLAGVLDAGAYLLVYLGEERVWRDRGGAVWHAAADPGRAARGEADGAGHAVTCSARSCRSTGVAVLFLDRLDVSAHQAVGVVLVIASVVPATVLDDHEAALECRAAGRVDHDLSR
jgi:hypothetical protein